MKILLIESEVKISADGQAYRMPAQSFGFVAMDAAEYCNKYGSDGGSYGWLLNDRRTFEGYLDSKYVPVGCCGYVTDWLRLMGAKHVKPLNIPEELSQFTSRDVAHNLNSLKDDRRWYVKSANKLRDPRNGMYASYDKALEAFGVEDIFAVSWEDGLISEWRVFVYNNKVRSVRCYSGDDCVTPDKGYAESIANAYNRRCYALDLMVYRRGNKMVTDIVELHHFFACELYGFKDYSILLPMWECSVAELLAGI